MRAIWVDAGNDADTTKLKKHAITDAYFDVRDLRLNPAYMGRVRLQGLRPGLYLCSQGEGWPSAQKLTGREWADWAYQQIQRIADGKDVKACLNCETHDPDWIVAMLKRWRSHSPRRETSWALEGHQGGLFTPAHVTAINKAEVLVVPEFFHGDMKPQSPGVVLELLQAGFKRLSGFYDAAALPYNWGAGPVASFAFTQGRLP